MRKHPKDTFSYATVPKLCPGGTVVCIASGPSLTVEDVEYCRGKVDAAIVVNNSYQIAPWADCLVASDLKWWHWHQGAKSFKGLKYATSRHIKWTGVQILRNAGDDGLELDPTGVRHGLNSGFRAINIAFHFGAKTILLLGYDCQLGPNKEGHWHKDHPIKSDSPYKIFNKRFRTLVQPLAEHGVTVINCTRRTALDCFPQMALEDALQPRAERVA
jgi:hypothetical protein